MSREQSPGSDALPPHAQLIQMGTGSPYSGTEGMHDLSRNHINVLSCAAIVALPGEAGTLSEIALAIRYGKPVTAYSPNPALVEHFPRSVKRAATIEEVKDFLRLQLAPSP